MISMGKQLFLLLFGAGIIIVLTIAVTVNITIEDQFGYYVESKIQQASQSIVEGLTLGYIEGEGWKEETLTKLMSDEQVGMYAVSILDADKTFITGMTEEELRKELEERQEMESSFLHDRFGRGVDFPEYEYITRDVPIAINDMIVGYARIGYFPSSLLSIDDMIFQEEMNRSIERTGILALIYFSLVSMYITTLFTKPFYAITRTSKQLAEGNYEARLTNASRIEELEHLRNSMNYLAQKLDQQDNLRKKLIADVSHEIRTPLHILQSNLEAMLDGIYPIDDVQMQVLYQEVLRFGNLLTNLDKLKNIEGDYTELKLEEMHVNTALKEIYNTFKIVSSERSINYWLEISDTENVIIKGDYAAFKQILMNLVSNAFKFTASGRIMITTVLKGKRMFIIVEDTGIGIPEEDVPYVFERMYRADKSRERYEGSGIGLTIVKKLVAMHSGRIDVISKEGVGTTFTIELPVHEMKKTSVIKALSLKN